tara:strand:- start:687 stop:2372 length:1686 start_codon:yes stop_codon:yes gene_type:complete
MTDYNVDNYTISELYRIIDKTTQDSLDDIREKIGEYKNKFDNESRPELSNFMTNILNAITLDRTTKNVDNENKQKKEEEVEKFLEEEFPTRSQDSDRYTSRKNNVQYLDDGTHFIGRQQKIGVQNQYNLPIIQGELNPRFENFNTRLINVDSQYRDDLSKPSTDFTFSLSDTLAQTVELTLQSIELPLSWHNISYSYGTATFIIWGDDGGGEFRNATDPSFAVISIPDSYYDLSGIVTTINYKLEQTALYYPITEQDGISQIRCGYEIGTGKFYFYSQAKRNFSITFYALQQTGRINQYAQSTRDTSIASETNPFANSKTNHCLGWLLGFRKESYTPSVATTKVFDNVPYPAYISDAPVDITGPRYLLILVDDFNRNRQSQGIVNAANAVTKDQLNMPEYYRCDLSGADTGTIVANNRVFAPGELKRRTDDPPRHLTTAQIYTINEILSNRINTVNTQSTPPSGTDILARIPVVRNQSVNNAGVGWSSDDSGDAYKSLPATSTFQYMISNDVSLQSNTRQYFGPVDIIRMRVRLTDDKGNLIDLNGVDWSFSMKSKNLYQY